MQLCLQEYPLPHLERIACETSWITDAVMTLVCLKLYCVLIPLELLVDYSKEGYLLRAPCSLKPDRDQRLLFLCVETFASAW